MKSSFLSEKDQMIFGTVVQGNSELSHNELLETRHSSKDELDVLDLIQNIQLEGRRGNSLKLVKTVAETEFFESYL